MTDKQKHKYIEGIGYLLLGILFGTLTPIGGWIPAGFAFICGALGMSTIGIAGKMSDKKPPKQLSEQDKE